MSRSHDPLTPHVRALTFGAVIGSVIGVLFRGQAPSMWLAGVLGGLVGAFLAFTAFGLLWMVMDFYPSIREAPGRWPHGVEVRLRRVDADGRWRQGLLFVGPEDAVWQPRRLWSEREPLTWERDRAALEGERRPTSVEAIKSVHPSCRILQLRIPDIGLVEIAVLPTHEPDVRDALSRR